MRTTSAFVGGVLGLLATSALAQPVPELPALVLPTGVAVRLRAVGSSSEWIVGHLVRADSSTIALVPEGTPPHGANQLWLPRETVAQLEIVTGKKRQWLPGLLIGAAAGVAMGLSMDVDPGRCEFDDNYYCSRGGALAEMTAISAAMGTGIGALFEKDVWTPVWLDALGPPRARLEQPGLSLRAADGALSIGLTVRFGRRKS
jgi:hypothetical protein